MEMFFKKIKFWIYLTLSAILFMLFFIPTAAAIGISPSQLRIDNLARGSDVIKSIYISGLNSGDEVSMRTQGAIKDWITIYTNTDKTTNKMPDKTFIFPDAKSKKISIEINVPDNVPNGKYSGAIRFNVENSVKINDKDVAIIPGVKLNIEVEISGKEHIEHKIISLSSQTTEVGLPLKLKIDIDNKGNVIYSPYEVSIKLFDKYKRYSLYSTKIQNIGSVKPFTRKKIDLLAKNNLEQGEYRAEVNVYDRALSKPIFSDEIVIEVMQKGFFKKNGELRSLNNAESVQQDQMIKITGEFENTGELECLAKLISEIYYKDKLITTIKSDELLVEPGKIKDLYSYFTPQNSGEYKVISYVDYDGKRTRKIESTFKATGQLTGYSIKAIKDITTNIPLLAITAIALFIISIVLIAKRSTQSR